MKVASRALCAAIACALGIESTAAFADDASSAPSTDADLQLETITVTAEKREQSVNDIGVAVTAFSARDVEQLGFSSYKDIADQTPGLSTVNATSGGTPIFAIRGIGLDDFNSNNTSGVGVYIDNVLAAYPVFLNGQLFDIERIEVLKGPQGTLYGRNTTGGAINYISIKPTDTFDAYQTVGFGSWNTWRFNGALNGPIGNGADGRIAYSWEKGDGWQHDIDTGRAFGSTDRFAMRAQVSQFFGDITEVLLNVHATRDTGAPLSPQNETVDAVYQVPPGTYGYLSDDPRRVRVGNFDLSRDESGAGASSTVTVSFPSMTFMSIAGFDHYSRKTSDNYDGTAQTTDNIGVDDTYSLWSQEFRLSSAGTQRLNWIMGAVGSYDKINGL
ncbi:MAG TPA: TonB-dependent receptor plug domain-containing protein, partial [Rudaea sp.]|nr:TonB-dependent receptor plug domain-containing protein [Rudaea sp.]